MKLTKKQIKQIIEDKIEVDCYGEGEIISAWATYLDDYLSYPFTAKYQVEKKSGQQQWQMVKVVSRDSSGINYRSRFYHVKIELREFILSVKLSDLKFVKGQGDTEVAMQVLVHRHQY